MSDEGKSKTDELIEEFQECLEKLSELMSCSYISCGNCPFDDDSDKGCPFIAIERDLECKGVELIKLREEAKGD